MYIVQICWFLDLFDGGLKDGNRSGKEKFTLQHISYCTFTYIMAPLRTLPVPHNQEIISITS